jgi:cobalt-zinc-cadmium efflux system membrane fusion protein
MQTVRRPLKTLVVDDDDVLLQVLSRVLSRAGFDVLRATTVAEALRQADSAPEVALLDLSLPDGDGVELARTLHSRYPGLPLILMTAHSNRLREHPDLTGEFAHVLTKPMDLHHLQQVLNDVLPEEPMTQPTPIPKVEPVIAPAASVASHPVHSHPDLPEVRHHASRFFKAIRSAGLLLIVAVVLVIFLGFILGVRLPGMAANAEDMKIEPPPRLGVDLVKGQPHTLVVPEDVRASLGIRKAGRDHVEVVKVPTQMRPLTLYGSTQLDPTRLMRIRARFAPCEVVQIGQVRDLVKSTETGKTVLRELRPGDRVQKGDVLGVFFSADVGSKKNDLLDALVQYELDQKVHEKMTLSSAIPEVMLLNQWRNVQSDRNAINRALNNLKVWNIPQEEIDALHEEAKKLSRDKNAWFQTPEGRWVKGEKQGVTGRDVDKENENPWAKVTLRAPFDGIIVERNVTLHEMVVDNTVNLFQLAQVHRLQVIAYAPEDELPTLNALMNDPKRDGPVTWSVRTVGPVPVTGLKGPVEEVGYLIDPNQHTAVIKGYIDNPNEQIRAGQFVSCTIRIPPPEDVAEVPIDAVVEDGKYGVVFVQTDPEKHHYTMRRVQLTHRFEGTAFVRSKPFKENERWLTPEEKELGLLPLEPLRPDERIVKTGVGELKAALLDLESRPAKDTQAGAGTIARQDAARPNK